MLDLDALEAALLLGTLGEMELIPNGSYCLPEDKNYWGFDVSESHGRDGFQLTGVIDRRNAARLHASWNALPALIARIRELEALTEWRPIETAPKDGTPIEAIRRGSSRRIVSYYSDKPSWTLLGTTNEFYPEDYFTHWRPLSAGPEENT